MELIKHECGIAMIRLLKPLSYYEEKYHDIIIGYQILIVPSTLINLLFSEHLARLFHEKLHDPKFHRSQFNGFVTSIQ